MSKSLDKRMSEFFKDVTLPHYSFWVVVFGCFLTGLGAYFQYAKELKASNDATIAEKKRVDDHLILLDKSKCLIDSTAKVLTDTKQLLEDTEILLGDTRNLLIKADATIEGQAVIIDKQENTINEIRGGDKIPKLVIAFNPINDFNYQVSFKIINNDKFTSRGVKMHREWTEIDVESETIFLRNRMKAEREFRMAKIEKDRVENAADFGPVDIPSDSHEEFKPMEVEFNRPLIYLSIMVTWKNRSYTVFGKLDTISLIPKLDITKVTDDKKEVVQFPQKFYELVLGNFESGVARRYEYLKKIELEKKFPRGKS